ncbi:hypothetical protein LCGC14_2879810, partial [marine sediment metagenome]
MKWCPRRSDPHGHVCIICGSPATEHHHVDPRGMGGSPQRRDDSANVVLLCHTHHEDVTTGGYKDAIEDGHYVIRNQKKQVVVKKALEEVMPSAARNAHNNIDERVEEGAEARPGNAAAGQRDAEWKSGDSATEQGGVRLAAASPEGGEDEPDIPETKGEAASLHDGEAAQVGRPSRGDRRRNRTDNDGGGASVPEVQAGSDSLRVSTLALPGVTTETSWEPSKGFDAGDIEAAVHAIKSMEWNRQWYAGDFANWMERTMGEAAWQYLSDLGYQPESLSN